MKVEIRKTIKYGSGKYLYIGEVYDLESDIPDEVRNVIMRAIDDHRNIVRTSGNTVSVPEKTVDDAVATEPAILPEELKEPVTETGVQPATETGVQPATETKSRPLGSRNKR